MHVYVTTYSDIYIHIFTEINQKQLESSKKHFFFFNIESVVMIDERKRKGNSNCISSFGIIISLLFIEYFDIF